MLTRRTFVAVGAAATLVRLSVKPLRASTRDNDVFSNATLGAYTQGILTQAHFETLRGDLFMILKDGGKAEYVRLAKVTALPDKTPPAKRGKVPAPQFDAFFLTFTGVSPDFQQGSYVLDNGHLGRFACLLVPGRSEQGEATVGATFVTAHQPGR